MRRFESGLRAGALCLMMLGAGAAQAMPNASSQHANADATMLVDHRDWDRGDRHRGRHSDDRDWRRHGDWRRHDGRRRNWARCYTDWQYVWTYYGPRFVPVKFCEPRRHGRRW